MSTITSKICAEFFRVTRVELMKTFLSSLDEHSAQLIKLYRSRSGKLEKELKNLLDIFDEKTTDVLEYRKSTALRGLPLYLKEQSDGFLKTCLDTDPVDVAVQGMELGILTVVEDDVGTVNSFPTTRSIALIIEEQIVLDDISSFPTAFALLFGLIYALNLDYPKNLRYTFEVIQKVFLNLGTDCSARVQALKNSLLK
uniref:Si:dkey-88l16.2 n=1 Tax=Nothobranchius pienaari TaxID=704102 RepID=A0A1A8QA99_9TELE